MTTSLQESRRASAETLSPPKDVEKAQPPKHEVPADGEDAGQASVATCSQPGEDPFLVHLDAEERPKSFSFARKVVILAVISSGALCSTFASSVVAAAEQGMAETFRVSQEVTVLGISLFALGVALGPLFVGPLSEVYGRSPVYQVSYALFFAFTWPVAFASHISVFLVFRFVTGFCSAAFLTVAGGSVSDMWAGHQVGIPTAVYTMCPFIGPALGPLVSGFINQNTSWRWTYRVLLILIFVHVLAIFALIPETYEPALRKYKAKRLRNLTGDSRYYAPLDRREGTLAVLILVSCYRPFELLLMDSMNLLLDLWTAMVFGILYLTFEAYPYIFGINHGFNLQCIGLAFIGMGTGMILGTGVNIWIIVAWHKRHPGASPTPETHLLSGMLGAVAVPASLYWLAFTSYAGVHWAAPVLATALFGAGVVFCFSATFTYLVSAYRPRAASAMAANTFARSVFAAAFPLFARQMYARLNTDGATALLAGVMTVAAPLPFIFYRRGAQLRAKSRFANHNQS